MSTFLEDLDELIRQVSGEHCVHPISEMRAKAARYDWLMRNFVKQDTKRGSVMASVFVVGHGGLDLEEMIDSTIELPTQS